MSRTHSVKISLDPTPAKRSDICTYLEALHGKHDRRALPRWCRSLARSLEGALASRALLRLKTVERGTFERRWLSSTSALGVLRALWPIENRDGRQQKPGNIEHADRSLCSFPSMYHAGGSKVASSGLEGLVCSRYCLTPYHRSTRPRIVSGRPNREAAHESTAKASGSHLQLASFIASWTKPRRMIYTHRSR